MSNQILALKVQKTSAPQQTESGAAWILHPRTAQPRLQEHTYLLECGAVIAICFTCYKLGYDFGWVKSAGLPKAGLYAAT